MSEVIPEGWSAHELEDLISKIEGGGTPSRTNPAFWNGQVPWATVKDLKGIRLSVTEESITEQGLCTSASRLVPANTPIIATRMAVGKVVVFDKAVAINQDLKAIYPSPRLDAEFLLYWYSANSEQIANLATGSTVKGIRLEMLRALPLSLPPLPEQQKIATILSSVDDVIEKTRAQIDKLKDLKTGMMQELLTQGIGHAEFKDSPVGRIPASWGLVTLEQLIGKLEGGVSVNGENRPKGPDEIGVLKVSSVLRGKFLPNEYKTVLSTDVDRARINPTIDRILFSRANTPDLVGESAYVDKTYEDLFLPDKIWMLDVRDRLQVNVRWLSYILCSGNIRRAISDAATGTSGSMKNISKSSLLAITVPLPTLDEQKNIAKTLEAVDNELTGSTARLHTYENLKKALMQDLLTGKVRVKLDPTEVVAA